MSRFFEDFRIFIHSSTPANMSLTPSAFHFLLLIFLQVLIQVLTLQSDYSMLVTYGEPTVAWDPVSIDTESWDTCVRICYLATYCVMAHQTPSFCHHYYVRKVFKAQRLTAADESLIAIKGNKSSEAPCQSAMPTTISQQVYMQNSSMPKVSISYQFTYSSDTFGFGYLVTGYCDSGWQVFFRSTAIYCISVVTNFKSTFVKSAAVTACQKLGATLAGMETSEERTWVMNQVSAKLSTDANKYTSTAVWISGARRSECLTTNSSTVNCESLDAFNFEDTYLQTKSGYVFVPNQPDYWTYPSVQNCMLLWVESGGKSGLVDDGICDSTGDGKNYALRGYVCGKKAVT